MLANGANDDAVSRDDDAISDGLISVFDDGAVSVDDEARSCDGSMIDDDDDDDDDDDIGDDDDDKCVAVVGSVAPGGGC